jgi:hypothetical protein
MNIGKREARIRRREAAPRKQRGTAIFQHGGRTKEATNASRYINEINRMVRAGDYPISLMPHTN